MISPVQLHLAIIILFCWDYIIGHGHASANYTPRDEEDCNDDNACTSDNFVDGECIYTTIDCDDGNPRTIDTCDMNTGCQYETCDDNNFCTNDEVIDGQCIHTPINCDDGNPLTIDTCDITVGCKHDCNDNNACTREAFIDGICQPVDENDNLDECTEEEEDGCSPGLIDCDDDSIETIDVCIPSTGCQHIRFRDYMDNLSQLDDILEDLDEEGALFYEDVTTLTEVEMLEIIDWIKLEVTQLRTPFCWRRSYGRGWGEVLTDCPSPKEKIGALCYSPCEEGYSRQGTFDCQQECKSGWRDDGLFCRKPEYWRADYPWEFGDPLNDTKMFERCEARHGVGNCEKYGLIVYEKCRHDYSPFGCCICRPSFSNCEAEGYSPIRIDLSCGVKITPGDPTPLICEEGLEQDGALCYPPCVDGYNGIGPVCWQECDVDQVNCGAGCAKTSVDCGLAVADQVLAPLIVAANIATLGATSVPVAAADGAEDVVQVGSKFYRFSKTVGKAMGWLASKLQTIQPENLKKGATIAQRIKISRLGTNFKKIKVGVKVSAKVYGAGQLMNRQFAEDFIDQTSLAIAETIVTNLDSIDVLYIQRLWGDVQYQELAEAEAWNVAGLTLAVVGLVDVTGITDLVNAYAKPVCLEIFDFPVCKTGDCSSNDSGNPGVFIPNDPPEAVCRDIQAYATVNSNCAAEIVPISVDNGSYDPNRDQIFFSLEGAWPFSIDDSPHTATMIVTDSHDASDRCTATISVSDITPSSIACPVGISQNNDAGKCGAIVTYDNPEVNDNCESRSTTIQIAGNTSGSAFAVGTTTNTFMNVDSLENINKCSFNVAVFDIEAPEISCNGLEATLPTDPGVCIATYNYDAPIGVDNCEARTVRTQSPNMDPSIFPLGTSTVEYTSGDPEGNEASCTFDVLVEDHEVPRILCPPTISKGTDTGACTAVILFPDQVPIGTDNCPGQITDQTSLLGSGSTFPIDESIVSYLVTDSSSNSMPCSFTVNVFDDEIPVGRCIPGVNPGGNAMSTHDKNQAGFFRIIGSDNCEIEKPGIKAYIIDSGSGTRFPTEESGFDYYELGTTFKYTKSNGKIQERPYQEGGVDWKLRGNGDAYVQIVDEAGNISLPAYCESSPPSRLRNRY